MKEPEDSSRSDMIIGLCYLAVVSLNILWFAAERDNRSFSEIVETQRQKVMRPWHDRRRWRRTVNEVIVEAWIATEGSDNERDE